MLWFLHGFSQRERERDAVVVSLVSIWWRCGSCMASVISINICCQPSVFLQHYIELYRWWQVETETGGRIQEELMRGHVTKIRLLLLLSDSFIIMMSSSCLCHTPEILKYLSKYIFTLPIPVISTFYWLCFVQLVSFDWQTDCVFLMF